MLSTHTFLWWLSLNIEVCEVLVFRELFIIYLGRHWLKKGHLDFILCTGEGKVFYFDMGGVHIKCFLLFGSKCAAGYVSTQGQPQHPH